MKEAYQRKLRNTGKRQRKKIILCATEGKTNKTEQLYLRRFNSKEVQIVFTQGNATDPEKLAKELARDYRKIGLKESYGDAAFCIVDADVSSDQEQKILAADIIATKANCQVIVSNPCFEIWYLCHFVYSTRQYGSSEEVVEKLREYIPDYKKNSQDIYDRIKPFEKTGIMNARKLEDYNEEAGSKLHSKDYLPSTEMFKVLDKIKQKKEGD